MANYVTHLAEVKAENLPPKAEKYLKEAGVAIDGNYYLTYDTPNRRNLDAMVHIAKLMEGRPFSVFIYEEDPGSQVYEGTITSAKNLENQIRRFEDQSEIALQKHEVFYRLSQKVDKAYDEKKNDFFSEIEDSYENNYKLLAHLTGPATNIYIAEGPDNKYFKTYFPKYVDGFLSKDNWEPFELKGLPRNGSLTCTLNYHKEGLNSKKLFVWLKGELGVKLESADLTAKLSSVTAKKKNLLQRLLS